MSPAWVSNIQRFSLDDGAGIRTTVFFKGCSLRCVWCHNPECFDAPPVLQFFSTRCNSCGKCRQQCPRQAHDIVNGIHVFNRDVCMACGQCATVCRQSALATGTSWGTIGTVGIALVGIGETLGIPAGLIGGAVVSGGYFGDKISPLSDTTNLAPAVCDAELFSHIKNMLATTIPSMVIAGSLYLILGFRYTAQPGVVESIEKITLALGNSFEFSIFLLVPAVVVILLAMKRLPAIPTLFVGAVLGGLTAMIAQGAGLHDVFYAMQSGFSSDTGVPAVDKLLSKGGIQSMMWVISLLLIALGFGGIIEKTRCLEVILNSILEKVKNRFGLVAASTGTAIGLNIFAGDPYLAIALPGRMFSPAYRGMGLSTLNLSRSIEEGGTLVNPLVPWNAGGAFVAGALGIQTLVYAPFAFACWLSPLIGLIYGYTGWFMPLASDDEKKQWAEDKTAVVKDGVVVTEIN